MALVEVNHQYIRDMANAIESYCDVQDREMGKADTAIKTMLSSDWIGQDALTFGGQWEGVDSSDSTSKRFKESLQNYSKALKSCADAYQTVQEDVYNLASLLPRF